jgi:hypothetical protein
LFADGRIRFRIREAKTCTDPVQSGKLVLATISLVMCFEFLHFTKKLILVLPVSFEHNGKKGEPGSICNIDGSVSSIVTDP